MGILRALPLLLCTQSVLPTFSQLAAVQQMSTTTTRSWRTSDGDCVMQRPGIMVSTSAEYAVSVSLASIVVSSSDVQNGPSASKSHASFLCISASFMTAFVSRFSLELLIQYQIISMHSSLPSLFWRWPSHFENSPFLLVKLDNARTPSSFNLNR